MAESTSSCVYDDRLSDHIDTPGTSSSSKDLSEQVINDVEPLIHVYTICCLVLRNFIEVYSFLRIWHNNEHYKSLLYEAT